MSKQELECYVLPSVPMPILLPVECIAEVVASPKVDEMSKAPTNWMRGHANWQNQRLPVLSYAALHDSKLDESRKRKSHLVVLNPIPNAARKAYAGLLCFGDVKKMKVGTSMAFAEIPENLDRRYVDAVVKLGKKDYMIPKLTALSVAFTYF